MGLWQYAYKIRHHLSRWWIRYRIIIFSTIFLLLLSVNVYLSPTLQHWLEQQYSTEQAIEGLRALILSMGGALIGATAIVTSLVLFAMQVNIERMPHGLFHRLSTDRKLLGAFALALLMAIGVATLSTVTSNVSLAIVVSTATWAIVLILVSFMYAYRRALVLINPLQQLKILTNFTHKELLTWARRAQRVMLPDEEDEANTTSSSESSKHDMARTTFFQINNRWTDSSKQAIRHAMSFAQHYAERGDHEVAGAALNAVIVINASYIESKGKTFFVHSAFVENPLATDSFINDTLEHLRQYARAAIVRQDEQQIEQALRAIAALIQVYLVIDYSSSDLSKSHAQIAAGYLESAVEAVVPHDMADVLMEGQRLMGQSARHILAKGDPIDITTLSKKIAMIACTGYAKEKYYPVTSEGMKQLANLTFDVLRRKNHDIHFIVGELRQDVSSVVKLFLNVTERPLSNTHSTYLGPYYSSTSTQSLRAHLTTLVNEISQAQSDNEDAQTVIHNIERWADGLNRKTKELLLVAINVKSYFTFDMIHWITGITELLLAVSNAPACDHRNQQKLRKHALWLISTLTFVPDDKETVGFIENFRMTETLFDAAMGARRLGCDEIAEDIGEMLLSWTFKGGKHEATWGILEKGLCSLAVLALAHGDQKVPELKTAISMHVSGESAPAQEIRDRTAKRILEQADYRRSQRYGRSSLDRAIAQSDYETLRPLLQEIADLITT